jgi:arsenate reductase-like glutaredoxin family protein
LRDKQLAVEEINYAKTGLTEAVVRELVAKAGGVAPLVNTRHAVAKARGWATTPPSVDEFAKAVAAEPNVIRRPILVDGKRVIVGFDRAAYAKLR